MRQCGSVSWFKFGQWVVFFSLLFAVLATHAQNLPPVPDLGIPNQHARAGEPFSYTIPANAFRDENKDPKDLLQLTITGLPAGLTASGNTISGVVASPQVANVTVLASDGQYSSSLNFKIIVHDPSQPYAAFSMSVQRGCGTQYVKFSNRSEVNAGVTYNWDFGNGNSSKFADNTAAVYASPGTYTVTLSFVYNSITYTYSDQITVYPKPVATISRSPLADACEPFQVTLTANPSGAAYYQWFSNQFTGQQQYTSVSNSAVIGGLKNGVYTIDLTVTDANGCEGKMIAENLFTVYDKPENSFTFLKDNACQPSLTTFTRETDLIGSTLRSATWTVDGQVIETLDNPYIHDFNSTGEHIVSLVTVSGQGCISDAFVDTVLFNSNNSASFNVIPTQACLDTTFSFDDNVSSTIVSRTWDFDGDGTIDASGQDPTWTYTEPGTFQATLNAKFNDGCERVITHDVLVENIKADFIAQYQGNCSGSMSLTLTDKSSSAFDITSWKWYYRKGFSPWTMVTGQQPAEITGLTPGNYSISLVVANGICKDSINKSVLISESSISNIILSGAVNGCSPAGETRFSVMFSSAYDEPVEFSWDFDNNGTYDAVTASSEAAHTYTLPGVYSVKVRVRTAAGCFYERVFSDVVRFSTPLVINNVTLNQIDRCYSTGISLQVEVPVGADSLRFIVYPGTVITVSALTFPVHTFNYRFKNIGVFYIDVVAFDNGCESSPYRVSDIYIDGPKAVFSTVSSSFCNIFDVAFSNLSTNNVGATTDYSWNFGDGTSSTEKNPSHKYGAPGSYMVTLEATDPTTGCSDVYQQEITLYKFNNDVEIIQTAVQSGCAPLAVEFTLDDSQFSSNFAVDSVVWNFRDGTIVRQSALSAVNHTFQTPGNYAVAVQIFGAAGACSFSSEMDNAIKVKGPIINDISYSPQPVCSRDVTFTAQVSKTPGDDGLPVSYYWTFGDGADATTVLNSTSHQYSRDSVFSVFLKVTDSNGCSSELMADNLISITSFDANFAWDQSLCNSTTVSFHNRSQGQGLTYYWNFGDGKGVQVKSESEFAYSFGAAGSYPVSLRVVAPGGCEKTYSETINVINITAGFSAVETNLGCAPAIATFIPEATGANAVAYIWNYGDDTPPSSEPAHKYYTPGDYTVSLQVYFDNGCVVTSNPKVDYVHVEGAYAKLQYDPIPRCSPNEIVFSLTEMDDVDSITWDFGDGNPNYAYPFNDAIAAHDTSYRYTNAGFARPSVVLTSDVCGSYTFEKFGEIDDLKKKIYTSVPPVGAMEISDLEICQGVPVTFIDRSVPAPKDTVEITTWQWTFMTGSTSDKDSVEFAYPNWGNYQPELIVSNRLGCTDTVTSSAWMKIYSVDSIHANIDFPFDEPYLACPGTQINFEGSASSFNGAITAYKWNFGDTITAQTQDASHAYDKKLRGQQLNVLLVATDDKQCSDTVTRIVTINNLQAALGYEPQPVYRGDAVDFTDESVSSAPLSTWQWSFTGGQPSTSTDQDPTDIVYELIDPNYSVSLRVTDETGCTDQITQPLQVLNNPPVVSDFMVQFFEGINYSFRPDSFLKHYTDNDLQAISSIRITSLPDTGKLFFNGVEVTQPFEFSYDQAAMLEYRPPIGWFGTTSFGWNASDGIGFGELGALVNVVVLDKPEPPIPLDFVIEVAENEVAVMRLDTFIKYIENTTFPGFTLDSIQIVSIPASTHSVLNFNGASVQPNTKYSSAEIGSKIFTVELPFGYNQNSVSFLWNGFDGINWGTAAGRITIVYKNKPPQINAIVRTGLAEDSQQTIAKNEFLSNYFDADLHDSLTTTFLLNIPSGTKGTFKINGSASVSSIPFNQLISLTYIPSAAFDGVIEVLWGASDGQDTTWAAIRFEYVNAPPIANDINVLGREDEKLSFRTDTFSKKPDPFEDVDKNDNLGSIRIESLPQHGTLMFGPSGSADTLRIGDLPFEIIASQINYKLVFIPELNWHGSDSFTYSSNDGSDWSASSATVFIEILPVNDVPVALNDTVSFFEDGQFSGYNVMVNDSDVDNLKIDLSVTVEKAGTAGANGQITLTPDGMLLYIPNQHFFGNVYFTYSLCDPAGLCSTATVFIEIQPVNDPPLAVNDTITILENDPGFDSDETTNLLANDIDPENNPKIVVLAGEQVPGTILQGNYGTVVIRPDGSFSYVLDPTKVESLDDNDQVFDSFTYQASDDDPESIPTQATLVIIIDGLNSPPTPVNDIISVDEDVLIDFYTEESVLSNDTDPENNPLSLVAINSNSVSPIGGSFGEFSWTNEGIYKYDQQGRFNHLPEGATANVQFDYTVSDGGLSSIGVLLVTINGVNDAPIARNDLLEFDIDLDSMTVDGNSNNRLLFNDFDYDDNDQIEIVSINGLSGTGVSVGSVGILRWTENYSGTYTYIPDADSIIKLKDGDEIYDVFTYVIKDSHGATDTASLTITIRGKNDNPLSNDDIFEIWEDTLQNSMPAPGLLANDSDPENDPVVVAINDETSGIIVGRYGRLEWDYSGAYTYYSDSATVNRFAKDSVYTETFRYRMKDSNNADSYSFLYVRINGQNDAPYAINDYDYTNELDTIRKITVDSGLLKNDYDIDYYDSVSVLMLNNQIEVPAIGVYGQLFWASDGTYTYVPNEETDSLSFGEIVTETFDYTITDLHDSLTSAQLIINITGTNDSPVAVNDTIQVSEDSLQVAFAEPNERLLFNDFDVDRDSFWVYSIDSKKSPSILLPHSHIEWDSTGAFTYYRNPRLDTLAIATQVIDSVRYRIVDQNNASGYAWLYIYILGENDAPVAVRDHNQLIETTDSIVSDASNHLLANDYDVDKGDTIVVNSVGNSSENIIVGQFGELWWQPDGSYVYFNNSEATDSLKEGTQVFDYFPYTIVDKEGATAQDTLQITITGVNDHPLAINDTLSMSEDELVKALVAGTDGLLDNDVDVDNEPLRVVNFDNRNQYSFSTVYGEITWDQFGSITFEPDSLAVDSLKHGEVVIEKFTYVVSDAQASDTAQLVIIINGLNDAPTALNDSVFINEDTLSVKISATDILNLLANDTDIDGDSTFVLSINDLPEGNLVTGKFGTLLWGNDGSYTYYTNQEITDTLAYGETVSETFEYILSDVLASVDTAMLVIQIDGVNDPPVAVRNGYRTYDRIPIAISAPSPEDILYNDTDVDGDYKELIEVNESADTITAGVYGTLTWSNDGGFEYKPDSASAVSLRPLETVVDTFVYKMHDEWQAADTSLLHFTIEGINNPPRARKDTLYLSEDESLKSLPSPGLLIAKNVDDPDKDTLMVQSITGPLATSVPDSVSGNYGYMKWDSAGNVTYYPNQDVIHQLGYGEFITETFTYTVVDQGDLTATSKLIVHVLGQNDPITAFNDTASVNEDTWLRYNVCENDSDIDFDWQGNFDYSTLTIITSPLHGSASRNSATGEIYYNPDKDFYGEDSLQYRICDTGKDPVYCDEAWFYIHVLPVNDPPVATHLVLKTPMNTPVGFNYPAQVNDIDDGIDSTSFILRYDGDAEITRDEVNYLITYTPVADSSYRDEFIYSMTDNSDVPAYVIVTVLVGDTLSDFYAQNDTITTLEDTDVDIYILANDTIGSEFPDPRSVEIEVFPVNGVAVFDPVKQIVVYSPDENFNGKDSLQYILASGPGNWDFAWVYITVSPVGDAFKANDDYAETDMDKAVQIAALANDVDPDNLVDVVSLVAQPQNGTAIVNIDQTIGYTPMAGFVGNDSFYYRICDTESSVCDSARIIVVVSLEEKLFEAMNDDYSTNQNEVLVMDNPLPTSNDKNTDATILVDTETFDVISGPDNGNAVSSVNVVTYTPTIDYFGPDWMQYIVADSAGNWDMAEINIWVNEINTPPVAVNDTLIVTNNEFKRIFVLENDYDTDGSLNWSTLAIVGNPQNGEVVVDTQTGTILYKPSINSGDDRFTYKICDTDGQCAQATVYVTIELETTIYIYRTIPEDTPVTIDVAAEMAKYNLTFAINEIIEEVAPDMGSYVWSSNNELLTYSPDLDLNGKDTIQLNVWSGDHSEFAYLRIFITILPVNDAPVAIGDTLHWLSAPDTLMASFEAILANDYDVDGDTIHLSREVVETGFDGLSVVFNADSTIVIASDSIEWCNAWFIYQISDGVLTDTAIVQIWPSLEGILARDDEASVFENSIGNRIDVLANDSFVDNQRCTIDTIIIVTPPQHGVAQGTYDNFVEYSPTCNYYGQDEFMYQIIDIWGQESSAWVYVDVIERNRPPVAVDDSVSNPGQTVNIPVLDNDFDPDALSSGECEGDPEAHIVAENTVLVDAPMFGTAIFDSSTNSFVYTPEEMTCTDYFTYAIFDEKGASDTATVTVDFSEAPIMAITDSVKTYPGIPVDVAPLLNDIGYFFADETVIEETYSLHGFWNRSGNEVTYTSDKDFIGHDSLMYTIISPCGVEQSAWIVFLVEELRVPEIITPNGDGSNDVLIIDGIEYFPDSWLQIYNRYGHIVYEKKRYDNSWGGYSNKGSLGGNKPLPSGTYYYALTYNEGRNKQAGFIYIFW